MNGLHRAFVVGALIATALAAAAGQGTALPSDLDAQARRTIEGLTDSMRAGGLPVDPVYAKVAEGRLKQATDAQIVAAVRGLWRRFSDIHMALGKPVGSAAMSAAATALASGVPMTAIVGLSGAAGKDREADADFTTALITLTDLVEQKVPASSAVTAVQSLLARRAPVDQYARLRVEVRDEIGLGRSPDQAVRARTEAIVRSIPALPSSTAPPKPPL